MAAINCSNGVAKVQPKFWIRLDFCRSMLSSRKLNLFGVEWHTGKDE